MITLLFVFFASHISYADYCEPMRLDGAGQSMEEMPIFSQNDIGNCYSVAVAQMIDAYRFSHGDKNRHIISSPIAIAANAKYYQEAVYAMNAQVESKLGLEIEKAASITGGLTDGRMVLKKNIDYFDAGSVSGVFATMKKEDSLTVCDYKTVEKVISDKSDLNKMLDLWKSSSKNVAKYAVDAQTCALKTGNYLETIQAIQSAVLKTNLPEYIDTLIDKSCSQNQIKVQVPRPTDLWLDIQKVHQILSFKNPQPVAVSYCANFVLKEMPTEQCAQHVSVIIGRRRNSRGKCEFLVRNSWGESCKVYSKAVSCERGQFWVEEEALASNSYAYSALLDPAESEKIKPSLPSIRPPRNRSKQ